VRAELTRGVHALFANRSFKGCRIKTKCNGCARFTGSFERPLAVDISIVAQNAENTPASHDAVGALRLSNLRPEERREACGAPSRGDREDTGRAEATQTARQMPRDGDNFRPFREVGYEIQRWSQRAFSPTAIWICSASALAFCVKNGRRIVECSPKSGRGKSLITIAFKGFKVSPK